MSDDTKTPPAEVIWNQVQIALGKIRKIAGNLEALIDGSNADSFHVHSTTGLSDVTYGTFTPTGSNLSNLDSLTFGLCTYAKVGNAVIMSGQVDIDPTAAGACSFNFDLPVAPSSNFSAYSELGGVFNQSGTLGGFGTLRADTSGNKLGYGYIVVTYTSQVSCFFTCMYRTA